MWSVQYVDRQDKRETTSCSLKTREEAFEHACSLYTEGHDILYISGPSETDKIEGRRVTDWCSAHQS
jgi:hypothetical protein